MTKKEKGIKRKMSDVVRKSIRLSRLVKECPSTTRLRIDEAVLTSIKAASVRSSDDEGTP